MEMRGESRHAKDSCTASNIEHHFVLEDVPVLVYGVSIRLCANFIFLNCKCVSETAGGSAQSLYTKHRYTPTFLHGYLPWASVGGTGTLWNILNGP